MSAYAPNVSSATVPARARTQRSRRPLTQQPVCLAVQSLYEENGDAAIEAKTFSGYGGLRRPKCPPQAAKDRVLIRVTAAGVTALDHTILSGRHPRAKAPLVCNEGVGVIEDVGDSDLAVGSRVIAGPYSVAENGTWQEWLLVRPEHLALVPDAIDDVVAASLPVAYLTAQVTLTLADFKPGRDGAGCRGSAGRSATRPINSRGRRAPAR